MNKYRITWYDQNSIILVEPELITADNKKEARDKAYIKYDGNPPGPCILIEQI